MSSAAPVVLCARMRSAWQAPAICKTPWRVAGSLCRQPHLEVHWAFIMSLAGELTHGSPWAAQSPRTTWTWRPACGWRTCLASSSASCSSSATRRRALLGLPLLTLLSRHACRRLKRVFLDGLSFGWALLGPSASDIKRLYCVIAGLHEQRVHQHPASAPEEAHRLWRCAPWSYSVANPSPICSQCDPCVVTAALLHMRRCMRTRGQPSVEHAWPGQSPAPRGACHGMPSGTFVGQLPTDTWPG